MPPFSLSIVIPAYNEARRLRQSVERIEEYFASRRYPHETLIVDDGSQDNTRQLAQELAQAHPEIRVLQQPTNRGKGAATRRGVLASRGDYILCTDADLSTPIEELDKLLPRLERGFDVAIGSRKVPESRIAQPLVRRIIGDLGNVLIRLVLRLPFYDTQCGFKLYRRKAARKLFGQLLMPRFSFDYEILSRAQKLNLHVAEVGVRWRHVEGSTVRARDVMRSFFDVFRVRFGLDDAGVIQPTSQLLRFMAVGVVNTVVDTGVYLALTRGTALFAGVPVSAKLVSFLAATVSSFVLNRHYTFGVRGKVSLAELGRFYLTTSSSLLLNITLMYVLVHLAHVYDLVALVVTTLATFALNYTLSKRWVFRHRSAARLAPQY